MDNSCFLKLKVLKKCSFKDKSFSPHIQWDGSSRVPPLEQCSTQPWAWSSRSEDIEESRHNTAACQLSISSLSDIPHSGKSFLVAFQRVPCSDLSKPRALTVGEYGSTGLSSVRRSQWHYVQEDFSVFAKWFLLRPRLYM